MYTDLSFFDFSKIGKKYHHRVNDISLPTNDKNSTNFYN